MFLAYVHFSMFYKNSRGFYKNSSGNVYIQKLKTSFKFQEVTLSFGIFYAANVIVFTRRISWHLKDFRFSIIEVKILLYMKQCNRNLDLLFRYWKLIQNNSSVWNQNTKTIESYKLLSRTH